MPDFAENPGKILEIRLFGALDVRVHGSPVAPPRTRKCLWLLALLALRQGRAVERDEVAALLWPDSPGARYNLRRALSDLRVILGEGNPALHARPQSLRLDPEASWVDVVAFDTALRGARLADAVALYAGPLLPGCYEGWALPERDAREERYLQALERLGTGPDPESAVPLLRKALRENPHRESVARVLLEAFSRTGKTAEMRQLYRDLSIARLPQPLDTETVQLYRRLTAAVAPKSPGVPRFWSERTSFLGRDRELAEIVERLGQARLVTLTGPGGCGKTRLAFQIAARLEKRYPDGIAVAELAGLAEGGQVDAAVAAACGATSADPRDAVREALRHGCRLLVLDNCEHVLAACASLVVDLLRHCPALSVLTTSREPLSVAGEARYPVLPLALPPRGTTPTAADLQRHAATRLLVERAQAARPGFVPTDANAPALAEICWRLDGIPLAIELAAARLHAMGVADLQARLEDRLGLLTHADRSADPRQRTLRALLDWSYHLLDDDARGLLRRLSVFAGGWTLPAAESVCAGTRTPTADLLAALTRKSLLYFDEHPDGTGRYRMLETVREYAAEKLAASDEAETIRRRHWEWGFGLARHCQDSAYTPDDPQLLRQMDHEHDNLRAALRWASLQDRGEEELRLLTFLCHYWISRGHFREGAEAYRVALARPRFLPPTRTRLYAVNSQGALHSGAGHTREAIRCFEEVLEIAEALADPRGQAMALGNLGKALAEQQSPTDTDLERARDALSRCIALFRELGNPRAVALNLNLLGVVCKEQRRLDEARRCYAEALRDGGFGAGMRADIHGNLGNLCLIEGDLDAAEKHWQTGLSLQREAGFLIGVVVSLYSLGEIHLRQARPAPARERLTEALGTMEAHQMALGPVLLRFAALALHEGRPADAATLLAAAQNEVAPDLEATLNHTIDPLRSLPRHLDPLALARAWAVGVTLDVSEAVALARSV